MTACGGRPHGGRGPPAAAVLRARGPPAAGADCPQRRKEHPCRTADTPRSPGQPGSHDRDGPDLQERRDPLRRARQRATSLAALTQALNLRRAAGEGWQPAALPRARQERPGGGRGRLHCAPRRPRSLRRPSSACRPPPPAPAERAVRVIGLTPLKGFSACGRWWMSSLANPVLLPISLCGSRGMGE